VTLTVNIYRNILTIKGSKLGSSLFYCAASIGDLAQPIKVQNDKWFKFQGDNAPSAPVDERKGRIAAFRRRLQ
jgi:hypothetical protein